MAAPAAAPPTAPTSAPTPAPLALSVSGSKPVCCLAQVWQSPVSRLLRGRLAFLGIHIGAGLRGRSRGAPRERRGEADQRGPRGHAVSSVFHVEPPWAHYSRL